MAISPLHDKSASQSVGLLQRAASVLMLRQGPEGLEVFIQHRALTMDFAAGVVVYPGGRVDMQDAAAAGREEIPQDILQEHARLWANTSVADGGLESALFDSAVLAAAACREVAEETGTVLRADQLLPWANWVTPAGNPKRFDTFFYVAALEPGQEPQHQTTEATDSQWLTPQALFTACDKGQLRLMAPTRATLNEAARLGSLERIMAMNTPIRPVPPHRRPADRPQSSQVPDHAPKEV